MVLPVVDDDYDGNDVHDDNGCGGNDDDVDDVKEWVTSTDPITRVFLFQTGQCRS